MRKRILSGILAAALMITALPVTTFTKTNDILYGDVNGDGKVNLVDILTLKRYIAEENPAGFQMTNADVNVDKKADIQDLLMLKKYLAEWEITLGPGLIHVCFYDGERLIDTLPAHKGYPLGEVPASEKTSKASGVFAGWYTNPECTIPFYADQPVTDNVNVYAKYDNLDNSELTVTSFAQVDLDSNAGFTVVGKGDTSAITLAAKDGSDPVDLNITGSDPYTITAKGGFKEGASYELTLPEGLCFVGSNGKTLPDTIRTASFNIKKEVVDNIQFSDDVHYVKNDNPSSLKAGSSIELSGIKEGDLICFYKETNPKDRDYKSGNAYMDDPEVWFKAGTVSDGNVTLKELEDDDNEKMYDVPDNFPVIGEIPSSNQKNGTLTLAEDDDGYALDTNLYKQMVEEGVTADLAYANKKVNAGDFISIYTSTDDLANNSEVYFGKITAYNSTTGVITYVKSSAEEIESSMDLYIQPVLEGDDLVDDEAKKAIEEVVLKQVEDSGFAEEAGFMLAELATRTDGFRNMDGVEVLLSDENGNPLSEDEIALLNLGKSFELKDGVKLTVEVITKGDQLHFKDKGSVALAIGLDAEYEVEVEDDGKVVIDLSATFMQELSIGMTANGELVKKKILGIPIPIGVKVGSSVDLLSYTGVSVNVHAYTVAAEEKDEWEQLEDILNNPEKLADVLPEGEKFAKVSEGLKTVGDVFDKIDEVNDKIEQVRNDIETAKEYKEELEQLWEMVGELQSDNELPTKEKWEEMGEAVNKTNVSKDLMDMLDISTETELDAERYADGLDGLLEKYSEMLEKETDWVTLVQKEICQAQVSVCGLVIYVKADFVVRADMNIAMGASFQYQVGKRYNFWIKVGLFKPEAGSTTMDLVDEEFAFQFYIMGKIGLKMGVEATAGFAIGSPKVARVGIHLEVGPYVKLYGFFIYEYERSRQANSNVWISDERMAGALYIDFGLYLIVGIDAAALGDKFEVSYDFVDEEFPLLEAGNKKYPYEFDYEPMEDELVLVLDEDGNSSNGITMTLPEEYRALKYCNLTDGNFGTMAYDWKDYNYTFSNPNFSMNESGEISVKVPEDTRYMECDLAITYKYKKLAFSKYDMQVTVPLVWTNLAVDEISQYYTASVRVGNATDGYETVWSRRARKNQEFTLPTEEELKELIGYDEVKYSSLSFPDAGQKVSLIDNKTFDCTVSFTDYAVTVNGIENEDGTTRRETFHTSYGKAFKFSSLENTGSNKPGDENTANYTRFAGVSTDATITAGGKAQNIDLTQPITGKAAAAIKNGQVTASANYVDDSVLVTYVFSGIETDNRTERIRKGEKSNFDFRSVVNAFGSDVVSVSPVFGPVNSATTYYVECKIVETPEFTLSFEENGGSEITDMAIKGGISLGNLPTPARTGYSFDGWYADKELTKAFEETVMPMADTTIYAKWTAKEYNVTLHVNGGNAWENKESPVKLKYESKYGKLPVPTRSGYGFAGWFTEPEGGSQINEDTKVTILADQTLYAHWKVLKEIPAGVFDFGEAESGTYVKGQSHVAVYEFKPEDGETYKLDDFTFKYMRQGGSDYESNAVNAGTYNITISRPADNDYAKFEKTYTAVITVDKATRTAEQFANGKIVEINSGINYAEFRLDPESIDDLDTEKTKIVYSLVQKTEDSVNTSECIICDEVSVNEKVRTNYLKPGIEYAITFTLTGDSNYNDYTYDSYLTTTITTFPHNTDTNWIDYAEEYTVDEENKTVTIENEAQLAYLAKMVDSGKNYSGYTFTLAKDLKMYDHAWTPIGDYSFKQGLLGFCGVFDGNGHTIYGIHTSGKSYAGLFGYTSFGTIKKLTLSDSYISGNLNTGGFVGAMGNGSNVINCVNEATVNGLNNTDESNGTGGIAGYIFGGNSKISFCENRGRVDGKYQTGGIAGIISTGNVVNNVNRGPVKGTNNHTGGILGYISSGYVMNSANFGSVTGTSCVGGIAGQNEKKGWVLNCYTVGTVNGTVSYTGAVVGRNRDDDGATHQIYYLKNSASCKGAYVNASGNKTGSMNDGDTKHNLSAAYFTSPTSTLSRDADCGSENLISALNNWVKWWNDNQCNAVWQEGEDGYPLPTGEVNTEQGTKR